MNVKVEKYGFMPSGKQVDLISISHQKSGEIKLISYGAKLVSLIIPDAHNKPVDVVLGYNSLQDYINGNRFFGANPGPFANRIKNASFTIDGEEFKFQANENSNLLHSGNSAFESLVWDYKIENNAVRFFYESKHGEFGFPGNKKIEIKYSWNEEELLSIEYFAISDKPTHLNLTHHSYFNLDGESSGNILNHKIQINASKILQVDDESVPDGNYISVENTPFDLRQEQIIADRIFANSKILQKTNGFDQCFVIDKENDNLNHCARLSAAKSGIVMDVFSTLPGIQFYTGNHHNGNVLGKSGKLYPEYSGLCLEPQYFPNSPNIPSFPRTLLRENEIYYEIVNYKFGNILNI